MDKCYFLESFTHCPKCGAEFVDNNVKSKKCAKCGFTYYFNPSSAVVAIIKNKAGEILVSVRDREPAKGTLDLPGGFVDSYETAEQSVCREVLEECNLEVVSTRYLFSRPNVYRYSEFDVHTLDMFFECEIKEFDNLKADDDVAELHFIPLADIDITKFGLQSIREGLENYINN
ncbi:MAG: NUDIX domain-containing protein [Rikenellaceae bacterium]